MSTITSAADSLPLVIPYHPARLSVDDYHKMIADGTLTENRRLELLKGVLVEKMTNNPQHAGHVGRIQRLIYQFLPQHLLLRTQSPITLRDSEPEPDLAVVRLDPSDYTQRHPDPSEVLLLIEVSSTSLLTDRYKAEIYAEAGIPWYWIVNHPARRVEVYSQPAATAEGLRYGATQIYQRGDSIPVIVDGHQIGSLLAAQLLPAVDAP